MLLKSGLCIGVPLPGDITSGVQNTFLRGTARYVLLESRSGYILIYHRTRDCASFGKFGYIFRSLSTDSVIVINLGSTKIPRDKFAEDLEDICLPKVSKNNQFNIPTTV